MFLCDISFPFINSISDDAVYVAAYILLFSIGYDRYEVLGLNFCVLNGIDTDTLTLHQVAVLIQYNFSTFLGYIVNVRTFCWVHD